MTDITKAAKKKSALEQILIIPVISKQELALKAERLVQSDKLTYLEAIIQICDELDVDPEDMAKMVVGPLKDKLEAEAQRANILPKPNSLFSED
jgi:uncharacterized protein YdhG (YjbR/CyaY superfamily)